jgi:hypothetical protein
MNAIPSETFATTCIKDTLNGLRAGISHFSGPSSVAVIYSLTPESPLCIYDPDNLLEDHVTILRSHYLASDEWRIRKDDFPASCNYSHIEYINDIHLDGMVSYGGKSATVSYQMWFTEHHPDMFTIGPTERWLEHAVLRFSHDMANNRELYTGISGSFLREFAMQAIHDHLWREAQSRLGHEVHHYIYPILDAILGISKTREEQAWPSGQLVFIEPQQLSSIKFLARFKAGEQPRINHHKHVRKLLQVVSQSDRKLISDGDNILGIAEGPIPTLCLVAEFHGRIGFFKFNGEGVCSFADGRYNSTTHQAKLFEVEEALIEYEIDASVATQLFQIVTALVHNSQNEKHGCTLVLDMNPAPLHISGQLLSTPMDLREPDLLQLACALSKVDGALHIGADCNLYGFACLLDGHTIQGEDRSRGARYNSALRFSAEHSKTLCVVVSSDRPVSVIQNGMEFRHHSMWRSQKFSTPDPMDFQEWVKEVQCQ